MLGIPYIFVSHKTKGKASEIEGNKLMLIFLKYISGEAI